MMTNNQAPSSDFSEENRFRNHYNLIFLSFEELLFLFLNCFSNFIFYQKWTDMFVSWSPLGTYMVTVHPQGVQLWGGEKWGLVHQLVHEGVALIHFSPCENFLMTLSTKYKENDNPKDPKVSFFFSSNIVVPKGKRD